MNRKGQLENSLEEDFISFASNESVDSGALIEAKEKLKKYLRASNRRRHYDQIVKECCCP